MNSLLVIHFYFSTGQFYHLMLYTSDRRSLSTIDHSFPHSVIVQYVFMVGVLSVLCTVDISSSFSSSFSRGQFLVFLSWSLILGLLFFGWLTRSVHVDRHHQQVVPSSYIAAVMSVIPLSASSPVIYIQKITSIMRIVSNSTNNNCCIHKE